MSHVHGQLFHEVSELFKIDFAVIRVKPTRHE